MKKLRVSLFAALAFLLPLSAMAQSPDQFIEGAMEALRLQTSAHQASWKFGEGAWAVDMTAGTITFTQPDGVIATAPIQVVGTYSQKSDTFLWGWDHPSVPAALRKHALLAKEWGQKNGNAKFTTRMVKCSEDEAWGFAAVANQLGKANGVYRGPSGTTLVFVTFGAVTFSKKP